MQLIPRLKEIEKNKKESDKCKDTDLNISLTFLKIADDQINNI